MTYEDDDELNVLNFVKPDKMPPAWQDRPEDYRVLHLHDLAEILRDGSMMKYYPFEGRIGPLLFHIDSLRDDLIAWAEAGVAEYEANEKLRR